MSGSTLFLLVAAVGALCAAIGGVVGYWLRGKHVAAKAEPGDSLGDVYSLLRRLEGGDALRYNHHYLTARSQKEREVSNRAIDLAQGVKANILNDIVLATRAHDWQWVDKLVVKANARLDESYALLDPTAALPVTTDQPVV